jgi:flavorubredoxin
MAAPEDAMTHVAYITSPRFPREIAPGLHWIGGCANSSGWPGKEHLPSVHDPMSSYVVIGSERTALIDPGSPGLWYALEAQLEQALGGRTLDYIVPTHPEPPHTGNLTRLLRKYPQATVIGDIRDYWMFHPYVPADSYRKLGVGESVSLGDSDLVIVEAVWRDLPGTVWAYATGHEALFSADGLGYLHEHEADVCGLVAEELPPASSADDPRRFGIRGPFHWLQYRDVAPASDALRSVLAELAPKTVCSAHGAPITDFDTFVDNLLGSIARGFFGGSLSGGIDPASENGSFPSLDKED